MKRMIGTSFNTGALNFWLLILRIAVACFMLTHGFPKFQKLISGGEIQFADPFGAGPLISLVLVVIAEFFCSVFILLGLFTRYATIPLIITMAVAAFHIHASDPFGKKEMALLYLLIFITLAVLGAGKYSLDAVINKRGRR